MDSFLLDDFPQEFWNDLHSRFEENDKKQEARFAALESGLSLIESRMDNLEGRIDLIEAEAIRIEHKAVIVTPLKGGKHRIQLLQEKKLKSYMCIEED